MNNKYVIHYGMTQFLRTLSYKIIYTGLYMMIYFRYLIADPFQIKTITSDEFLPQPVQINYRALRIIKFRILSENMKNSLLRNKHWL